MTEAAKGVDHITDVTPIRYRRKLSLHTFQNSYLQYTLFGCSFRISLTQTSKT